MLNRLLNFIGVVLFRKATPVVMVRQKHNLAADPVFVEGDDSVSLSSTECLDIVCDSPYFLVSFNPSLFTQEMGPRRSRLIPISFGHSTAVTVFEEGGAYLSTPRFKSIHVYIKPLPEVASRLEIKVVEILEKDK